MSEDEMRGGVARGQRLMSVEPLIVLTSNIMISHNILSPTNITITITVFEWLSDRNVLSPLLCYTPVYSATLQSTLHSSATPHSTLLHSSLLSTHLLHPSLLCYTALHSALFYYPLIF